MSITSPEIPDGWYVVGGVQIIRCVDAEGAPQLIMHGDEGISTFEGIGMLTYAIDKMRKALME